MKKIKSKEIRGTHVSGLDIPNAPVILKLSETGVIILAYTMDKRYSIDIEKISNISWYDEKEEEKYQKSSFAKTLVGAAALGPVGAVIGSRPKEKTRDKYTNYLVIDYSDNRIVICCSEDIYKVMDILKLFKKIKPQSAGITSVSL
ncbi:MAG: hypothetical protein NC314_13370 [Roseburia sp.]|nr:hypothetical protein [Roseburia sp.]MCM1243827.1 hypothetical protein [Roseburia sp.]